MSPPAILPTWSCADNTEPHVRIGIVLAEDRETSITVELPPGQARLASGGTSTPINGPTTLRFDQQGNAVTLTGLDQASATAARFTIRPATNELTGGAGIKVHQVIAGRGFHWQRHYDQTFTGAIHVTSTADGLLLVNELPVEAYLAGVITAEMGRRCPRAYLEAQTIVARSWLLAFRESKHTGEPFDRCNDDCCQRYQGTADLDDAVLAVIRDTRGRVLLDSGGNVVDANYSKCCGGLVEDPVHVWGTSKPGLSPLVDAPVNSSAHQFHPLRPDTFDAYLSGAWLDTTDVYCSPRVVPPADLDRYLGRVDVVDDYFRWTVNHNGADLADLLARQWPELADGYTLDDLAVTHRGDSGRATAMTFTWLDLAGREHQRCLDSEYAIRAALHAGFLYSSAFDVRLERDPAGRLVRVTLRGAGWGHGAGLCQIGGVGMALCGFDGDAICRHYFPAARLGAAYR